MTESHSETICKQKESPVSPVCVSNFSKAHLSDSASPRETAKRHLVSLSSCASCNATSTGRSTGISGVKREFGEKRKPIVFKLSNVEFFFATFEAAPAMPIKTSATRAKVGKDKASTMGSGLGTVWSGASHTKPFEFQNVPEIFIVLIRVYFCLLLLQTHLSKVSSFFSVFWLLFHPFRIPYLSSFVFPPRSLSSSQKRASPRRGRCTA